MERRSSNTKRARHRSGTGLGKSLVPPGGFENSPRGEIGDAGVDGPNPAFRPEEPGTVVVPGPIFLWCPRANSKTPPRGELVTRVSTVRIRPLDQKSPGRIRTVDTRFRRAVLYPLSYGGMLY